MSREADFLSRWSRLKRRSSAPAAPAPEVGAPTDAEALRRAELAESSAIPELPPEELAALPPLDELTPETDLSPFLRKGVPAGLRNAALRRMWTLDPGIRDRIGDALDYAYDWNVAGSVPGTGPLLPSDDVQAMLRAIVGAPDSEASEGAARKPDGAPVEGAAQAEPEALVDLQADEAAKPAHETPTILPDVPSRAEAIATAPAEPAGKEGPQVRRHGGATPF